MKEGKQASRPLAVALHGYPTSLSTILASARNRTGRGGLFPLLHDLSRSVGRPLRIRGSSVMVEADKDFRRRGKVMGAERFMATFPDIV